MRVTNWLDRKILLLALFGMAESAYAGGFCERLGQKILAGADEQSLSEYPSISSAISASEAGWTIYIENILNPTEGIRVKDKSDLMIKSRCMSVVEDIDIDSSSNIVVENIKVSAQSGQAIRIKSGAKFSHDLTFKRLIVDGNNLASDGIAIGNKSERISIEDSVVRNFQGNGIHFLGSFQVAHVLKKNKVEKNGLNGVALSGKMTVALEENVITQNGRLNVREDGYGLKAHDQNISQDIWVKANFISNNNGLPIPIHSTIDIYNYPGVLDQSDVGNSTTDSQEGFGVECPILTEFVPSLGACFIVDGDDDAITSKIDNCPKHANTDQLDEDNDGIGTACDPDEGLFFKGGPSVITVSDKSSFQGWVYSNIDGHDFLTPEAGPYRGKAGVVALNDQIQIYFPPGAFADSESIYDVRIVKKNSLPEGAHTDVGTGVSGYDIVSPRHRFPKYVYVKMKLPHEKIKLFHVGK